MLVGWTVWVSRITLLLGRRWRADRSWIDLIGRASGFFWVLTGFGVTILFLAKPFVDNHPFLIYNPDPPPVAEAGGEIVQPVSEP
jgi:hypothetical protein